MKEFSETSENNNLKPIDSKKRYSVKKWLRVSYRSHPNKHKDDIDNKMFAYDQLIKRIKEQLLSPGDVYFERDYRHDPIDPFSIHAFLTATFRCDILCDPLYEIKVLLQFQDCPFENEVVKQLQQFRLCEACYHPHKLEDLPTFLQAVIAYQDPKYIHTH